ncbi:anhydro-N-acetylmuramic acid kinase [Brachybacterium huguangmaarense]
MTRAATGGHAGAQAIGTGTATVLGILSGTSIDAIDTALVAFRRDAEDPSLGRARILATGEHPWDPDLRSDLLAVLAPASSDVGTWCRLHAATGDAFGAAARAALDAAPAGARADLIASHGQTLFHDVVDGRVRGSLQIGDAARIAAATGVPVLADLRAADIAAGGHGAPLVPLLDELVLGDVPSAVVNIGGIANLALVGTGVTGGGAASAGDVVAGDTGPGNALLDAAVHRATEGRAHVDVDARLARTGRVDAALLQALLADPFYAEPFPRSTGREHFDADHVRRLAPGPLPDLPDLLATLVELTALTIARGIEQAAALVPPGARPVRVVASGGGMRNPLLAERLRALLAPLPVVAPEEAGLPSDAKEAVLMALIGWLSLQGLPGTLARADGTAATGAARPVVLGSLTPPGALVPPRGEGAPDPVPLRRLILEPVTADRPDAPVELP